ncbi:MAG TPA: MFS transporter [Caulobacteraceae bacterium]
MIDAALLPPVERRRVLILGGVVLLLLNFAAPNGGLIGVPISFFLKNRLHLAAHELAIFNLWTGAPLYAAFLFGFLRDRWSPFGTGDRGHLVLFGAATAAIYGAIAFASPTYAMLFAGVLIATAALQTVSGAANGLISALGQEQLMAGQASTVINISTCLPAVIGYLLGGVFSELLEGADAPSAARALFLVAAGLMAIVAVIGGFGPQRLFTHHAPAPGASAWRDVTRLVKCWPVYPPLIMLVLWDFAPASGAVLQYHLANTLHASDSQVGAFYAIFYASVLPTIVLYGILAQRVRLSKLLFWGTVVAIPQWVPLVFVHSPGAALLAAVPIGLMGGLASAAYVDLAIRSCPRGLQGTMMMLVVATTYYVAARFGDVWGTELYDFRGGLLTTVVATTIVYALILPALLLAPKRLTSTTDGQGATPASPGGLSRANGD